MFLVWFVSRLQICYKSCIILGLFGLNEFGLKDSVKGLSYSILDISTRFCYSLTKNKNGGGQFAHFQ